MGKKNKTVLGRALIKDRFSKKGPRKQDSMLHVAELNDGYDWGRLNLQSVTEESSFQEFLSTAELAGTEFQAEKLNITFVDPKVGTGLLGKDQQKKFERNQQNKKDLLKIPRRPKWNKSTTAEELQTAERQSFLEWRRHLALLQEEENLILTPYEKNLEFWRQLWRVVEKSDVVVQILDARNPLMFRSEDLEHYVKEVDAKKKNLLLINKSDFLSPSQRQSWGKYFNSLGMRAVFFSAVKTSMEGIKEEDEVCKPNRNVNFEFNEHERESSESDSGASYYSAEEDGQEDEFLDAELKELSLSQDNMCWDILDRERLIKLFENIVKDGESTVTEGITTVGLVGYPNVGKSSTINALLDLKKVSVSATPGKTKHFQTLYLTKKVLLCDCPGLVFPSLVSSKAEMVINGILPIDQMRDHVPSVTLLISLIPRPILEGKYSIMLPKPRLGEDSNRPPTSEEFLNAYAYSRGFMTQNGQPDNSRAARHVLKDFVQGKLLYCTSPPTVEQSFYQNFTNMIEEKRIPKPTPQAYRAMRVCKVSGEELDNTFFRSNISGAHKQGIPKFGPQVSWDMMPATSEQQEGTMIKKPWKDHSAKRNKREKLRRVYRYLDE